MMAGEPGKPGHDVLDLDTRRQVFAAVSRAPGAYLRELQRGLGMPMGMLEYHLGRLEKAGLVSERRDGHRRFFPTAMPPRERALLAILRPEACRRAVLEILRSPGLSQAELARRLGLGSSTLRYSLAKLVDAGIVGRTPGEAASGLHVVDAPIVLAVLARHRPGFLDAVLDRFLDAFEGPPLAPDEDVGRR